MASSFIPDITQPTVKILIDILEYKSEQADLDLSEFHIEFGIPRVIEIDPLDEAQSDTFTPAVIDPAYDFRFAGPGQEGFIYKRLDLGLIPIDEAWFINPTEFPTSVHAMLDQINETLGVQFEPSDLVDQVITVQTQSIELLASSTSLVWLGRALPLAVGEPIPAPMHSRVTATGGFRITDNGGFRVAVVA